MAKKKQQQVPGTEREEIPDLVDAAESLRLAKMERAEVTARIHDASAHLDATILRLAEEKAVKLPKSGKGVIHVYDDEDGKIREVTWSVKNKGDVKGRKDAPESSDDE